MHRLFKSAVVGLVVAFLFGALAYALSPRFPVLRVYVAPARYLIPGFDRIANDVIVSVFTGGGTPAGIYLILAVTLLFWTVIFGGLFLLLSSRRTRQIKLRSAS